MILQPFDGNIAIGTVVALSDVVGWPRNKTTFQALFKNFQVFENDVRTYATVVSDAGFNPDECQAAFSEFLLEGWDGSYSLGDGDMFAGEGRYGIIRDALDAFRDAGFDTSEYERQFKALATSIWHGLAVLARCPDQHDIRIPSNYDEDRPFPKLFSRNR